MTATATLPQRVRGASLPPEARRAIGRATVVYPDSRWSTDLVTLACLLEALRAWNPDDRPAAVYPRERPQRQAIPRRRPEPVNGHAGNAAHGYPPLPASVPIPPAVMPADDPPRFVIHLPVALADLNTAKRYARQLCVSLAHLPEVDAGQATVSYEDGQHEHHRVFCDQRLRDKTSCLREHGHFGPCGVPDE